MMDQFAGNSLWSPCTKRAMSCEFVQKESKGLVHALQMQWASLGKASFAQGVESMGAEDLRPFTRFVGRHSANPSVCRRYRDPFPRAGQKPWPALHPLKMPLLQKKPKPQATALPFFLPEGSPAFSENLRSHPHPRGPRIFPSFY